MTTRARKAKPVEAAAEVSASAEVVAAAPLARCNVRGCEEHPEWRGLCPAHRQTHRGLMDPKENDRG